MTTIPVRGGTTLWCALQPGLKNRNVATEAYQNAVKHLKNELGISQKGKIAPEYYASIEEIQVIVQDAKAKHEASSKDENGVQRWLERFSSRIMYYGRVLDTLAQHHPEYVALAWGSLKFVLVGVLNHATLVQKLAQALVEIGDVLPRAKFSAELYQTDYMQEALSRLYAYIILFFQLCVRWYNKSPIRRVWSSVITPFELDWKELTDQIMLSSKMVEDLANSGARSEIRLVRTLVELQDCKLTALDSKLLEIQAKFDQSMSQLVQITSLNKSIAQGLSCDLRGISSSVYRIEFHQVMKFLTPRMLPETTLSKAKALVERLHNSSPPVREPPKMRKALNDWVSLDTSSLLVVRVIPGAQSLAKELAAKVVGQLNLPGSCLFWKISLAHKTDEVPSISDVLKSVIFQVLRHSDSLFVEFVGRLNSANIQSQRTELEWADLLCMMLSKIPRCFIIIETEDIHRANRHDPALAVRFVNIFQAIVQRGSTSSNVLKVLLVMYGSLVSIQSEMLSKNINVVPLQPPIPVPRRLKHTVRRTGKGMHGWTYLRPKF